MAEKIRMLIVDDVAKVRSNLRQLLELEANIEVVGEAANGEEALVLARELKPDLVIMDIGMPVMDGIQATETMTIELPQTGIIILSCQDEGEYLRKAMAAGARDYLTKPPAREEMLQTIHRVYKLEKKRRLSQSGGSSREKPDQPGKIISFYSSKGGVGKSVLAVNLAVTMARLTQKKTALVDLNLQFGDVAILLDLLPRRTISDLAGEADFPELKTLNSYLTDHSSGVKVLPAPLRPEYAEVVRAEQVGSILKALKESYDYIIVDTHQLLNDPTLAALDISDFIIMVIALDILTVKNVKLVLEAIRLLNYEPQKIKLVLNRVFTRNNISIRDLEEHVNMKITHTIPHDAKLVMDSCNLGSPFVISHPAAPISKSILKLARELAGVQNKKRR